MLESLTTALQKVFRDLRGRGRLDADNVREALREVRRALLEADVNFQVARDFIRTVQEDCLGEEVLDSITPGQQIIKRIHERLIALLGGATANLHAKGMPSQVMLLGLHGAGKTTTAAKLARRWLDAGQSVLLVACDLRRPAAVSQLEQLAAQVGVPCLGPQPGETVPALGRRALDTARREGCKWILYDTGGRLHLDEELVAELQALRAAVAPENTLLVLDGATGQQAVDIAQTFHQQVGLTGLILTKLDGDARGGAALSVRAVTGCPILFIGVGERPADLEAFHPDRLASRILGFGDVISLVEKAGQALDEKEVRTTQEKLRRNQFTLEDFLAQMRQMRKLGPIENLLDMLPGMGQAPAHLRQQLQQESGAGLKRSEAIICSMTPRERRHPELLNGSRRKRIALGAGVQVRDVNELLKGFDQTRKMMRKMGRLPKGLRGLGQLPF
ncbi:MAG: signal recognition particle protein [Candidatus Marinimicrobia bacterium]|nr:signal recognition particle protein [Candidatus Neomarinimicrobiota bacterium]